MASPIHASTEVGYGDMVPESPMGKADRKCPVLWGKWTGLHGKGNVAIDFQEIHFTNDGIFSHC